MSVDAVAAPPTTQVVVPMCTSSSSMTPLSLTLPTSSGMLVDHGGGPGEVRVPGGEALLAAAESHLAATARAGQGNPAGTITVMPITPMVPQTTVGGSTPNNSSGIATNLANHTNHHQFNNSNPQPMETNAIGTNSGSNGASSLPTNRHEMFNAFQTWALQNYGDSGKTKTVTRNKYERIVRTLSGKEQATTDNSKFRFWVKAKGFRLGPSPAEEAAGTEDQVLYVPTRVTVLYAVRC